MGVFRTVKCRYNAVQYNMSWHKSLQELRQNTNQRLNPQKTPHTSPSRASYAVSFVTILDKIDCVMTALHCIFIFDHYQFIAPWWHHVAS